MQIVYLLKENEPKEKVAKICNVKTESLKFNNENKILGYNYAIVKDGDEDFQIINNYFVPKIYEIKEDDSLESLQALGYEIVPNEKVNANDIVLLNKISGKRQVVKPLEKINDRANMYYTSVNEIIKQNNLKSDKLFIGQIIYL